MPVLDLLIGAEDGGADLSMGTADLSIGAEDGAAGRFVGAADGGAGVCATATPAASAPETAIVSNLNGVFFIMAPKYENWMIARRWREQ
jgi:hypothetical protein